VRQIVLLRGINLGPNRRVAMPALREALTAAGFAEVQTYAQSGNVVLSSDAKADELATQCERLIAEAFGIEVPVVTRTRDELAQVVKRDPLGHVADNPKRYQVSFLSAPLEPGRIEQIEALRTPPEQFAAIGRELYAWHPQGVARSKLWNKLAGTGLGVTATARNWTTVTTLLAMASE
jgi:uncharacterized protein (DUF1697 family)